MTSTKREFTSVEICAGAGGQAYGLHEAKFRHLALIEIDKHACETLKLNVEDNAEWEGCEVIEADLLQLDPHKFRLQIGLEQGDLDLLAGGVPCPPFSIAGKQLGEDDERDLFPTMLKMVDELQPKAVMIENVRGLLDQKFQDYREKILKSLESMGYSKCYWKVLEAKDYGVPQLRPRAILVAMKKEYAEHFLWAEPKKRPLVTVGEALALTMKERFDAIDDPRAESAYEDWFESASKGVAPTLVGGSKKHGGADLGPTRAKKAWKDLGVCGLGVANKPQEMVDSGRDLFAAAGPKLTVQQAAIIQGFPPDWEFPGRKTASYRQVGNAFPPPVAQAVGEQIYAALKGAKLASTTKRDGLLGSAVPSVVSAQPADRCSDLESAGVR
ncbi:MULTISPECIES: DNA cytosine methyltransferase [unclassified Streptomyces]|uniref:DNA cytosine methyltransferase n=1 Tax=unclassified Streptomyces TaxID=2593676 RepID=UPI002E281D4D|nr:DNA cytosine methyltransferase [Streptomyces sp. NBC_01429]